MSKYAYGNHDYEIECAEIFNNPDSFKNLMAEMLEKKDIIKSHLIKSQERFRADSMRAGEILSNNFL